MLTKQEFRDEFGNIFCKVSHQPYYEAIVMEWYGHITSEQISEVTVWAGAFMQKAPCSKLLNDCTNIISVWEDSMSWFSQFWILKMKRKGLAYLLHVSGEDSFGDGIGIKLQKELTGIIQFYSFKTMAATEHWLKAQQT